MATADEAKNSPPRIVKIIRLESYEDALNNITFDVSAGEQSLRFDDYLLQYMLHWETRKSATMLNVEKLSKPFSYQLHIHGGVENQTAGVREIKNVDMPETFAYLLGLSIKKRKVLYDDDRRYLIHTGTTRDGRKTVVIWRENDNWVESDYRRDKTSLSQPPLLMVWMMFTSTVIRLSRVHKHLNRYLKSGCLLPWRCKKNVKSIYEIRKSTRAISVA